MERLETLVERRLTGIGPDGPIYKTYHIGHGQQLARKREAARRAELAARAAAQPAKKPRAKKAVSEC
jgi:hypothetical protein